MIVRCVHVLVELLSKWNHLISILELSLVRRYYLWADNLSSTLQGSTVSASEGQSVMKMTLTALQSIRSDEAFALFWKVVEQKRLLVDVDEPKLPRQRKVPRRYEVGTSKSNICARYLQAHLL